MRNDRTVEDIVNSRAAEGDRGTPYGRAPTIRLDARRARRAAPGGIGRWPPLAPRSGSVGPIVASRALLNTALT
ncbi:hypothetical protein GCM10009660_06390 [Catellatospora bangladeshensis]